VVRSNQKYRIEKDSMGSMKVPKEAYYGAQTQRAVEDFPVSGLRFQREFLYALGLVKYATARVNFELNVMMPLIAYDLIDSIRLLANAIDNFTKRCIDGLKADRERCEEMIEKSLALATALASRIGYDKSARIVKKAYDQRMTIRQIVEEEGLFPKEELNRLFDPRSMLTPMKLTKKRV